MIMKSKAMTWAWILMLIQGFVMLIPCTFGFFYPEWSAGIFVKTIAGMSVAEVSSMYPELWQVIKFVPRFNMPKVSPHTTLYCLQ